MTCGHERPCERAPETAQARIVKHACGSVLVDGESVTLIQDLKLKGSSHVIKGGAKLTGIRLVDGDHKIFCKIDGGAIGLKCLFRKEGLRVFAEQPSLFGSGLGHERERAHRIRRGRPTARSPQSGWFFIAEPSPKSPQFQAAFTELLDQGAQRGRAEGTTNRGARRNTSEM